MMLGTTNIKNLNFLCCFTFNHYFYCILCGLATGKLVKKLHICLCTACFDLDAFFIIILESVFKKKKKTLTLFF